MNKKFTNKKLSKCFEKIIIMFVIFLVLIFIFLPLLSITAHSFIINDKLSLDNFKDVFSIDNFDLFFNSFWTSSLSAAISTIYAVIISIFAYISSDKVKFLIERGSIIAMMSPPFVTSLAYIILFGRRGLITYGLFNIKFNPYGPHGIVILQSLGGISLASLLMLSNLEKVDNNQIKASRDLGANGFETIKNILLPQLWPSIVSSFFLLFTLNLSDFGTTIVIGGNFKVLATEAYVQAISTPDLGRAATLSIGMIPVSLVAFYFYRKYLNKNIIADVHTKSLSTEDIKINIKLPMKIIFGFFVIIYFIIIILKFATIIISSFSNTATGSLQWTLDYVNNVGYTFSDSLMNSIGLSIFAGIIACFLGLFVSYFNDRRKLPFMNSIEFITSLPYVVPGIFFGLGYVAAFSKPPIYLRGTLTIILANMIFRQLSVPIKNINAGFKSLSEKIDMASRDLGASNLQTLSRVLVPKMKTNIISSFISVFTSSMTSMGALAFIVSPGMNVASMEIFTSVRNGRYGVASYQAFILMIVIASINLILFYLLRKSEKGKQ